MKKIFIVVEGETEERFLRQVVYGDFIIKGIHIEAQQWITNRKIGAKGGGANFDLIENHILRLVSKYKHHSDVLISTMIDLYAFPRQGSTIYDTQIENLGNGTDKALLLEKRFSERVSHKNFIPYIQIHEYESLLLSKPDAFSAFYYDKAVEIDKLKVEIAGIAPEDINDTPENAPSKRIIKYIPKYSRQKTTAGVIIAEKIGLPHLRANCPHFNSWITKLENSVI